MILGIQTEIGELLDVIKKNHAYNKPIDTINLKEEWADLCWYAYNFFTIRGISVSEGVNAINPSILRSGNDHQFLLDICNKILESSVKLYGLITQSLIYERRFEPIIEVEQLCIQVHKLGNVIHTNYNEDGSSMQESLTRNINKLIVRYPEKFDSDKALNRDLGLERKELEGGN